MPETGNRRILAFDFGTRRIGVASGQELLGTGQPLAMIPARDGIPDWQQVEKLLAEWQPDIVVVGLPLNMDDTENDMCPGPQVRQAPAQPLPCAGRDGRWATDQLRSQGRCDAGGSKVRPPRGGRPGRRTDSGNLVQGEPANLTDEASMTALLDINQLLDELETGLRGFWQIVASTTRR